MSFQVRGLIPVLTVATFLAMGSAPAAQATEIIVRERAPEVSEQTLTQLAEDERLSDSVASGAELNQKIWVYLTDKNVFDVPAYEMRLAEVSAGLDPHSAARRAKTFEDWLVDFHDIPVDAGYVESLRQTGVSVLRESRWLNAVSGRASFETWQRVSNLPFVQKLAPVRSASSSRTPAVDPVEPSPTTQGTLDYGLSFGQLDEINVVAVHDQGVTGAGVRIAMLDTGFYQDHAAFQAPIGNGQLIAQYDFLNDDGETQDEPGDVEGQHHHGTITWSIVGGFDEGELIGAAYGAEFLLAKTEDVSIEDPIEEDNWIAGMEWADANGADIISSSLGYYEWYSYEDLDGNTAVTTIGADIAASRGIVVCTAAGNLGTQDWYYIVAPADADSVIAVGGSTPDGSLWDQSSHGPTADGRIKPEVVARAAGTYGAASPEDHNGEGYHDFDGTSVATPLVAGAAALLLQAHPGWTHIQVREALMITADNAENPDNDRGWGRIDVLAAMGTASSAPEGPSAHVRSQIRVSPNPFTRTATISFGAVGAGPAVLEIFSPNGRRVRSYPLSDLERSLLWDGRDAGGDPLAQGVYLVRLATSGKASAAKLILSR
jgi:subtilisin family serine protease